MQSRDSNGAVCQPRAKGEGGFDPAVPRPRLIDVSILPAAELHQHPSSSCSCF